MAIIKSALYLISFCILSFVLYAIFINISHNAKIVLATGNEGGTFHSIGKHLDRVFKANQDANQISLKVVENTKGSIENIYGVINGDYDAALTDDILGLAKMGLVEHGVDIERDYSAKIKRKIQGNVQILAPAHRNLVQIVITEGLRESLKTKSLIEAIEGKGVYIGSKKSGTEAHALLLLDQLGLGTPTRNDAKWIRKLETENYKNALASMEEGAGKKPEIDMAFFISGIPTPIVEQALDKGLHLYDLRNTDLVRNIHSLTGNWEVEDLNAFEDYKSLKYDIQTISSPVYIVASSNLDKKQAAALLDSLYEAVPEIRLAQKSAGDIKISELERLSETLKNGNKEQKYNAATLSLHDGAQVFLEEERDVIKILSGSYEGRYFHLATTLKNLLKSAGIKSRIIPTQGSIENIKRLSKSEKLFAQSTNNDEQIVNSRVEKIIAFSQFDIALGAHWDSYSSIYKVSTDILKEDYKESSHLLPPLKNARRLGVLEYEELLVFGRALTKNKKKQSVANGQPDSPELMKSIDRLDEYIAELSRLSPTHGSKSSPLQVCIGEKEGGTRKLAIAVLEKLKSNASLNFDYEHIESCSLPALVTGLVSDKQRFDLGFIVLARPSNLLPALTESNGTDIKLLSLPAEVVYHLTGPALERIEIEKTISDNSQLINKSSKAVTSLGTRTILLTNIDEGNDVVKEITEALIIGSDLFGLGRGKDMLTQGGESIPFHPLAKKVYENFGMIPKPAPKITLSHIATSLAIIISGFTILSTVTLWLSQFFITRKFLKRIFEVDEISDPIKAIEHFEEIHEDIRDSKKNKNKGLISISFSQWKLLTDLIEEKEQKQKKRLASQLLSSAMLTAKRCHTAQCDSSQAISEIEEIQDRFVRHIEENHLEQEQYYEFASLIQSVKEGLER